MTTHVSEKDSRLVVDNITYSGETGEILAHFAMLKGDEKRPGVIIIYENRGLNPHTREVARASFSMSSYFCCCIGIQFDTLS
ncbi:hypothetical protein E4H04_07910 [Candidatus Bathyarchaeota archaeon]|nr:MAG: hypothetical protein E4H04_07910 [Candidatus Bathyarchaeota archaeon]